MSNYHIEPDPALPSFNRFFSNTPTFPISISFPQDLKVDFDLLQDRSLAVFFGYPWQIAVTRWDLAQISPAYAPFVQGYEDLYWYIKRDMEEMKGTYNENLRAVKYWIDKDRGKIGDPETKVPLARWKTRYEQYGEKIYFQRKSDPDSIVWTVLRRPTAGIPDAAFSAVLRSFRWLRF